MKSLKQIREASGDKEAYQKFFNSILKKFGVKSPSELEGDKKKEFYDAIDAGWEGDNEKPEKNENTDDFKSDEDVPDDKGNYTMGDMAEAEIKEKTKLKAGRGKLGPKDAIDINFMGDKKDIKFASTKWKINIKPHSQGAMVSGDKQKILAYLASNDYSMDDEDIEDLYPELLENNSGKSLKDVKLDEGLNSAQLKKAQAIASKNSGNMKQAIADIEKIKKGASDDKKVQAMLKLANEDTEDKEFDKYQKNEAAQDTWTITVKKKFNGLKLKDSVEVVARGTTEALKKGAKKLGVPDAWKHSGVLSVDKLKEDFAEAVGVDRRTTGFKEALKRQKLAKEKREAAKIKAAKDQAKTDMANLDANYAYDGSVEEILSAANKKIMGEDAAANASSSGAVDMNPTGKNKKEKKENPMAKYGY